MSQDNASEGINIPVNAANCADTMPSDVSAEPQNDVVEAEVMTEEEIQAQDAEMPDDAENDTDAEEPEKAGDEAQDSDNAQADSDGENAQTAETANAENEKTKEPDWKDAYIRLRADFDNYRKRTSKEFDDVRRRERERVIGAWLDVYDNAERALASMAEKSGPWYDGFSSLIQQMNKCLASFNIKPVEDVGEKFDPKRHEAIATMPDPTKENNTIMFVERKGFMYENGDIARVARVIVVKNPS